MRNNNDENIEMRDLIEDSSRNDLELGHRETEQRKLPVNIGHHLLRFDETWNVKALCRKWGPKLEFVVRLLLISTFLDDSFRTVTHFPKLVEQIGDQGFLKALKYSTLVQVSSTVILACGFLAQSIGSICLLLKRWVDTSSKALIIWVILQPILYGQLSNIELVAESLSLVGGLLLIRANLVVYDKEDQGSRLQLFGRLLLPSMYFYYAGKFLYSACTLDETSDLAIFIMSLSQFVLAIVSVVGLVISSTLVTVGLQSRLFAIFLAVFNTLFVFYTHPFFIYLSYNNEDGWNVKDSIYLKTVSVSLPGDVSTSDLDKWQMFDLQRYYFFMGMSISGALLLLAQFGPGKLAAQNDEVLLPTRARD